MLQASIDKRKTQNKTIGDGIPDKNRLFILDIDLFLDYNRHWTRKKKREEEREKKSLLIVRLWKLDAIQLSH